MTSLLPFWQTVKDAYRLSWTLRADFFRISRLWLIIATPIIIAYGLIAWPHVSFLYCTSLNGLGEMLHDHRLEINLYSFLWCLMFGIPGGSIAVAWHRLILRNETTAATRYLRLDKVVWGYMILAALIYLIDDVPSILRILAPPPLNITHEKAKESMMKSLVTLVLTSIALYYGVRMTVALPARALEKRDITVKTVLDRTRGNFWRLFGGHLFCFLPFFPLVFIAKFGCSNEWAGAFLYSAQLWLTLFVMLPVYLSFLSLSYKHFFEKADLA